VLVIKSVTKKGVERSTGRNLPSIFTKLSIVPGDEISPIVFGGNPKYFMSAKPEVGLIFARV